MKKRTFLCCVLSSLTIGLPSWTVAQTAGKETTTSNDSAPQYQEITDMAGRVVKIPAKVSKGGTFGSVPILNSVMEAAGGGKLIYNQPSKFHDIHGDWKMHLKFAPQLENGPYYESSGHEILTENILADRPDFLVTNNKGKLELLSKTRIPVIFIETSSPEKLLKSMEILGQAMGTQEQAKDFAKYFNEEMENLKKLGDKVSEVEKVRTLYVNPPTYRLPNAQAENLLSIIGANSVTKNISRKDGRGSYDAEDILLWNPEVIIGFKPAVKTRFSEDKKIKNVSAIKNNKIFIVPTVAHSYGSPNPELPLAGYWMMHKLYPDIVTKEMLEEKVKDFYQRFFHYTLTPEELNEIVEGG
ncbi:MAG: ABC transporter substrate-binding protein [Burkholderiales bacterium]|nr:ABC transporter substrate-binding protein [Burkholderiales bacterium]